MWRSGDNLCFLQLKMMATVHQTQPTIQLLLSTSDFVGALDLISTTQEVLQQELAGIQSFRYLNNSSWNGLAITVFHLSKKVH